MCSDSRHGLFSTHKSRPSKSTMGQNTTVDVKPKCACCYEQFLKKPARTTQSYFTCDKHIPLSEASELLVKRPVLCSPRCLHQHANRPAMCANSLKRPRSSSCQESLLANQMGVKHGSFNQIPSETFISYDGQKTRVEQTPLYSNYLFSTKS